MFLYFNIKNHNVKNKVIFIVIIFSLVELIIMTNPTVGFECNLSYLETSQDHFYLNENIELNSSWELEYNPFMEIAYVQVRIFNSFNELIWNSSKYDNRGNIFKNWSIDIDFFNLSFTENSSIISIKFFSYYYHIGTMNMVSTYLETIQIEISKRIPICQLIGFKEKITWGEHFFFKAKFLDIDFENNSYLINQSVLFKIFSNNITIYSVNFTTNQLGIIEIFLSSITHLNIGVNRLVFTLSNNVLYHDSKFIYQIILEKKSILLNTINIDENLLEDEDLEIELLYYYLINSSLIPLSDQYIELRIFDNQTLQYSKIFRTDFSGRLTVNLSQNLFNFDKKSFIFTLNFTFNGTQFLKSHSYSIYVQINYVKTSNASNSYIPILMSILIVSPLFSLLLLIKLRRKRNNILADITIRD
jgi:hypothetical protein